MVFCRVKWRSICEGGDEKKKKKKLGLKLNPIYPSSPCYFQIFVSPSFSSLSHIPFFFRFFHGQTLLIVLRRSIDLQIYLFYFFNSINLQIFFVDQSFTFFFNFVTKFLNQISKSRISLFSKIILKKNNCKDLCIVEYTYKFTIIYLNLNIRK